MLIKLKPLKIRLTPKQSNKQRQLNFTNASKITNYKLLLNFTENQNHTKQAAVSGVDHLHTLNKN